MPRPIGAEQSVNQAECRKPSPRYLALVSIIFLGLPLLALWSMIPQMRRDVGNGAIPSHYGATFLLLGALAAVMPLVALVVSHRTLRFCTMPEGVTLGGRYVAWTDITAVSWRGGRGANVLLLHVNQGPPLCVTPSVYSGGEAMVFDLLGRYVSPEFLAPAIREMQESD